MKYILANWKTSLAGVVIGGLAIAQHFGWLSAESAQNIIVTLGSLGLIAAKDGNVSGGNKRA